MHPPDHVSGKRFYSMEQIQLLMLWTARPPPRIDVGAVRAPTIVIPVLWFGTDFMGAASKEVTALQARQH
jgi:hypothetical protein